MAEFDPTATVRTITVKYKTVCSRCERPVAKGEEAVWYNHLDKREEFRPPRRIVCRACEPAKEKPGLHTPWAVVPPRSGGSSFRDYLRRGQHEDQRARMQAASRSGTQRASRVARGSLDDGRRVREREGVDGCHPARRLVGVGPAQVLPLGRESGSQDGGPLTYV